MNAVVNMRVYLFLLFLFVVHEGEKDEYWFDQCISRFRWENDDNNNDIREDRSDRNSLIGSITNLLFPPHETPENHHVQVFSNSVLQSKSRANRQTTLQFDECARWRSSIHTNVGRITSRCESITRSTQSTIDNYLFFLVLSCVVKGVYRLTQLRRLTFSDNEIQYISPELGQLVNLEELDCSRNDIAEIPDNIRHCRSLQKLDCSGNPLANK